MSQHSNLTVEKLKSIIRYNPRTGEFIWKTWRGCKARANTKAGCVRDGYLWIKVYMRRHTASRLAWFYVHGEWPKNKIDHKDGDTLNNRIKNLRDVTHQQNHHNRRKAKGYNRNTWGKLWSAKITVDGKQIHLGSFTTARKARKAYVLAKKKYHPSAPRFPANI